MKRREPGCEPHGLYEIGVSLGFATRGRCTHSIRPIDGPCSQCLGVIVQRRTGRAMETIDASLIGAIVKRDNARFIPQKRSELARAKAISRWNRADAGSRASSARRAQLGLPPIDLGARDKARAMRARGASLSQVAAALDVSISTVRRMTAL